MSSIYSTVSSSEWAKRFEDFGLPLITPQANDQDWQVEREVSRFHLHKASLWMKALEENTLHSEEENWSGQKSAIYVSMLRIQSASFFPASLFDLEKVGQSLSVSRQHYVLEKQGEHTAPGQIILSYIKSKNQFKVRFQNYAIGYTSDEYIVYLEKEQALRLLFLYSYFDLEPYSAFRLSIE